VRQGATPDIEHSKDLRVLEHRDIAPLAYRHLESVGPRKLRLVAGWSCLATIRKDELAVTKLAIERELEHRETAEEAVPLATPDETGLRFQGHVEAERNPGRAVRATARRPVAGRVTLPPSFGIIAPVSFWFVGVLPE
jgi:hypothetical protein